MRLLTVYFLLIAGCGPSPALDHTVTPQVQAVGPAEGADAGSGVQVTTVASDFELSRGARSPDRGFYGDPPGSVPVEAPSLEESCRFRRERLATFRWEYDNLQAGHAKWVADHCKLTLKHYTTRDLGGREVSRGPEKAWICDGKLVDSTESSRALWLAVRIGDLQEFLREKCDDHRGF